MTLLSEVCTTLIHHLGDAESLSNMRNARCTVEAVIKVREALKDVPARVQAIPEPKVRDAVEAELLHHFNLFARSFADLPRAQVWWGSQQWHWARLSREMLPIERVIATETRNYICLQVDGHRADKILALAAAGIDLDILPPDGVRALQKTLSMDERVVASSSDYYARCVEILADAGARVTEDLFPFAQTPKVRVLLERALLRQAAVVNECTPQIRRPSL